LKIFLRKGLVIITKNIILKKVLTIFKKVFKVIRRCQEKRNLTFIS
jgi:hypothetical protein